MTNVTTKNPPKAGELLLAEPFLADMNFSRSVVLLCECNDDGTVGFVLNKPLDIKLQSVVEEIKGFNPTLYLGGPVEPNTLHYLHRLGDLIDGSIEVLPGLFWGGSFESVKAVLSQGGFRSRDIRFFVGYSGWGSGQLEMEMQENSWIKTNLTGRQILATRSSELWRQIMVSLGGRYKVMANFPESPILN